MYRNISDEEATATVDAAWAAGIRSTPHRSTGPGSPRCGCKALAKYPRDEYVLATKVGRLVLPELVDTSTRTFGDKGNIFKDGNANAIRYDYTAEGTTRSIAESLDRLGVDRLDYVFIHDLAQDFHGDDWTSKFVEAQHGAFQVLDKLCDDGVITAWGQGTNKVEPIEIGLELSEPSANGMLLAGRYTILDHESALQRLMPLAIREDVDVIGGRALQFRRAGRRRTLRDGPIPPEIADRVKTIATLCEKHDVPIKAAALHFSLAHPAVAAVIPGSSRPGRIAEDVAAMRFAVPEDFWRDLRDSGVASTAAPLPVDD